MMAAISAAGCGHKVCLMEKNEKLGKKLFITGKGRCNVTNAGEADTFFSNVRSNGKFLYSAFYGFDNQAVMDYLAGAGCPLKVERGDRVFPVSDHSSDVIAALGRELTRRQVEVLLHTRVKGLCLEEERVAGVVLEDGTLRKADKVILATGGLSYPATGSTGDGYRFAKETGHRILAPEPSLVPLCIEETWCADLMGLSLKNVSLRLVCGGRQMYEGFGEMLFTHFGVSGPLVLSASSYLGQGGEQRKKGKAWQAQTGQARREDGVEGADSGTRLYLDLKPAIDREQLDRRLIREFQENRNRQIKNALGSLFPAKLIPVMVALSGIDSEKKAGEVTALERKAFGGLIKELPLRVTGTRGFPEAIITRGGVSVKDVNPKTMESRKVGGLYFAGEVLDLDALTGGFNLQIAWSTGYLAGQCMEGMGTGGDRHEL